MGAVTAGGRVPDPQWEALLFVLLLLVTPALLGGLTVWLLLALRHYPVEALLWLLPALLRRRKHKG